MGGTDCAQPMIYAKKKNLKVDVFIVYTDSETWAGRIHPVRHWSSTGNTLESMLSSLFVQ